METGNMRMQLVHDALKAAVAVGLIILIGVVWTAGIFGADYGVRKASAQTKSEIEGILAGYGLSEEQKEELYQEILKRLQEQLASGRIKYEGMFTKEDAEKLRAELEKTLSEELMQCVTAAELQNITNDILKLLEQEKLSREELLKVVNTAYSQQSAVYEQRIKELEQKLETSIRETEKIWSEALNHEIVSLRETLSEQIRVHSKEIESLQNGQTELDNRFAAKIAEMNATISAQLAELLARIEKNEKAIEEVFQLVSNGKALIASAITDEGVETKADAAFQVMADNIHKLSVKQYNEGMDQAAMVAEKMLETTSCSEKNDWGWSGYTAKKGGHCWIVGYFLVEGNGGSNGNDIDVDVWINRNGSRIYGGGVHGYIPGTGSNAYICYVQQRLDVKAGEQFAVGFHILDEHTKRGKRGHTGTVKQISLYMFYPGGNYRSAEDKSDAEAAAAMACEQDFSRMITIEAELPEGEEELETGAEAEKETEAETEAKVKTDAEGEKEAETEAEAEIEAETEAKVKTDAEGEKEVKTETDAEATAQ